MDKLTDEDIDVFIKSYQSNLLEGMTPNSKIPIWIEYLKTKKHYRKNGMDEDFFFNKRFGMSNDDINQLQQLIYRVKQGKKINKNIDSSVIGNNFVGKSASSTYSDFNEGNEYDESDANKFEIMSEVQSAMDDYYSKMKKQKEKKLAWKNGNKDYRYQRELSLAGSVNNTPDRYYSEEMTQDRPQIEYDVQSFARSPLFNMSKTNIINRIDQVNEILQHNNLITNDFDTEYKRAVPVINTNKKGTYRSDFDMELINKTLADENYMGSNNRLNNANNANNANSDPAATRFWQDQDILNPGSQTRKTAIKNQQPFENQFQYLDCNFNRVMDPRLIGESSRSDNRTIMKR